MMTWFGEMAEAQDKGAAVQVLECLECASAIDAISNLNWEALTPEDLLSIAYVYYYFSVQFRESLQVARQLYPKDEKLRELEDSECNTSNLSPWPGVAHPGEKIDHDEFMRRLLTLSPIEEAHWNTLDLIGQSYLRATRGMELEARAQSIASYEDGGLEQVFRAILRCKQWETPSLQAFRHFLVEHIRFDSDPEHGHGSLSRHLTPNDRQVLPFWSGFKQMLTEAAPKLLS